MCVTEFQVSKGCWENSVVDFFVSHGRNLEIHVWQDAAGI